MKIITYKNGPFLLTAKEDSYVHNLRFIVRTLYSVYIVKSETLYQKGKRGMCQSSLYVSVYETFAGTLPSMKYLL